jgi:hypothetical protein
MLLIIEWLVALAELSQGLGAPGLAVSVWEPSFARQQSAQESSY